MEKTRETELPVGKAQVLRAKKILEAYQAGKKTLEQRLIENEQWYRLRHWETMGDGRRREVEPVSAWLFNCIANKHADAMDNYPVPVVLPREANDRQEAEKLSSVLPVVLEQNDFETVYDRVMDYKLRSGTGVYGVFWDAQKLGGLGDIDIRKVDLLNLFWEPGITDIQKSRNVFSLELWNNESLLERYPDLKLPGDGADVSHYVYDESVDTSDKSAVVDWYYKRWQGGKQVLHYCKFVGDTVLFATENLPGYDTMGLYDHGLYPFVFDPLFSVEGSPCGFGYIDVGKSAQEFIDRGNQAILMNLLANARPRHFIRTDGSVNEEEYADLTRDFVHVDGNLGQDSILPVQGKPLSGVYLSVVNHKIDELKETTGNRDVSSGGTTGGATAASAIAAMQEAGSKLSRDANRASYRAFRQVCILCVELMRQYYDTGRYFRIQGAGGEPEFLRYSNENLRFAKQEDPFGVDTGYRAPLFDVAISARKQSPYSRISQNELALQFYNAGFFDPAMAQQALMCLDMMDFDRKEVMAERIRANLGTVLPETGTSEALSLPAMSRLDRVRGRTADMASPV